MYPGHAFKMFTQVFKTINAYEIMAKVYLLKNRRAGAFPKSAFKAQKPLFNLELLKSAN